MADSERLLAGQARATETRFSMRPLTTRHGLRAGMEESLGSQRRTREGATCGRGVRERAERGAVLCVCMGAGRDGLLMFVARQAASAQARLPRCEPLRPLSTTLRHSLLQCKLILPIINSITVMSYNTGVKGESTPAPRSSSRGVLHTNTPLRMRSL